IMKHLTLLVLLASCNVLKPRVPDDATGSMNVLPAGTDVPSIADNPELVSQIKLNQGLSAATLAMTGGVVTRSTGKANGPPVWFWSFGTAPIESGSAVAAPLYILATDNGNGSFTPIASHPYLIDTIPGDVRYSPIRRVVYVPVTDAYNGQVLPTMAALGDAL